MKPRKHKKMNSYFKSLEAEQQIRLSKFGEANREWYDSPTVEGTLFCNLFNFTIMSNTFKRIKGEQMI
jgi:hypothetical protein